MSKFENAVRAARAGAMRDAYLEAKAEANDGDATLIDMIADILHLAKIEGHEVDRIMTNACAHFEDETELNAEDC